MKERAHGGDPPLRAPGPHPGLGGIGRRHRLRHRRRPEALHDRPPRGRHHRRLRLQPGRPRRPPHLAVPRVGSASTGGRPSWPPTRPASAGPSKTTGCPTCSTSTGMQPRPTSPRSTCRRRRSSHLRRGPADRRPVGADRPRSAGATRLRAGGQPRVARRRSRSAMAASRGPHVRTGGQERARRAGQDRPRGAAAEQATDILGRAPLDARRPGPGSPRPGRRGRSPKARVWRR